MFAHVTIHTPNLEKSLEFYSKHIGLKVFGDLRPMGSPIVFLAKDAKDTKVELIEDSKNAYEGSGISIGFSVADVKAAHTYFEAQGLQPSSMIQPNPHVSFFFVKDPAGVSVQIISE